MVNRNLIRSLEDDSISDEFDELFADTDDLDIYIVPGDGDGLDFSLNKIVPGRIIRVG